VYAIIFVIFAAVWSSSVAMADGRTWKGLVDSLPADGLQGEWVVAGRTFVADANTRFSDDHEDDDHEDFDVGVCVEVEYVGEQAPFVAKKIAKKRADDCTQSTPESKREAYGIIQQAPQHGLLGDWLIGNVAYRALPGAEFKQRYGPLVVGACAKVQYSGAEAPYRVHKLESKPLSDCGGNGTIPPVTPTPQPGQVVERYGRIDSFPESLIGDWVVAGIPYVATDATRFKQENGVFDVGVCVKLHAYTNTEPATLRKVETERDHKCNDDDDEDDIIGRGELYGTVQSLPDGLLGEWNIAGITFLVDESTELEQKNGVFAVGVVVKVEFVIRTNGDFYAREIELKSNVRPNKGHAFGVIDSLPAERIGVWTIGGIDYQVTAATRLREKHGSFEVGARVRVKYVVGENGQRVATRIETTRSHGGVNNPAHLKAFGYVNQMPPEGLIGEWTINDTIYVAIPGSKFEEEKGLLGVGAYVAVEYHIVNGRNVIHELETKVPPGAGAQSQLGVIEAKQEVGAAAVSDDEVWRIGGVDYLITPATDIDELESELEIGSTAWVNSYIETDGTIVATEVRGLTISNTIFLPTVNR
jgi:hypothetical protein